ncbi:MAG: phosphoribosylformylglycinamidine cyclo-ligase [Chloroflexota bacterium]|nr:phosphoribosylformylglycinamidine cyclo-ligase [Chloroflexota bacterium]
MADARSAYADAGVDVAAGELAVDLLRQRIAPMDILGRLGGFGAAIPLPPGLREPVLVSATDGVGTKLEIARRMGRLDTVGRDLVAMCADDVVCHGARPWFFLDYVAVGRLVPERIAALVGGVADGCAECGCALVGGETAEHPGVMPDDAFDLAGFCVGIVERDAILDGRAVREGDAIVGIASSGLHANGFSLVRALLDRHRLEVTDPYAEVLGRWLGRDATRGLEATAVAPESAVTPATLGDVLLAPTRIYAGHLLALREELETRGLRLGGLAHVTGGGLAGNLPRAVPEGLAVVVDPGAWPEDAIFGLMAALGDLSGPELRRIFNCGIGMAVVVEPDAVEPALTWLGEAGLPAWAIGRVVAGAVDGAGGRYAEAGT